jgi:class 3 adenylate cyclase
LLREIAQLGKTADAAPSAPSRPAPPIAAQTVTPPAEAAGERRHITVMFCDLVGSTALSARMDPEDLREVISAYQKCVAETVQRFGGFVAKYMGDGVLVYFGYPQAHEDDAERGVRAGLELIQSVTGLKSAAPLQTRVGIATGLVVVGDLIGSGAAQEQAVVGETPNLAARMQGIAEPNAVVIAESTRKLLGNLFDLQDLGPQDLKGKGGPVRAWAVLRPASIESRFEALHATGLTELVGREEELELLLRRWSKAKTGEGQVVLLSGEPGIGKSRLTAALLERLATEPHTRLRYFCSPQHTDSALYPIISQMERAAGLVHEPPEDPLLLFSVLYGLWVANYVAFDGDATRELASQFLDLAEKQNATVPIMIGHRIAGISLLFGGSIIEGRDHLDRAIAVYDVTHRPLAMRFGQDAGVTALTWRSLALWLLGHSMAARADAALAVKTAREMGHAPTLMFALHNTAITYLLCSDERMANALLHEGTMLADEKGATFWTALGVTMRGCISVLTGQAANAVRVITSGLTAYRSTGSTLLRRYFCRILREPT